MITVFGSINVDLTFPLRQLPRSGETALTPSYLLAIGGKGANQAVAAARDGAAVSFVGCVGADSFGANARQARLLRALRGPMRPGSSFAPWRQRGPRPSTC